jgi:hypothetical protein
VTFFKSIDGVEDVPPLDTHECVSGSKWLGLYFFMEVIMCLRTAEMVTLGVMSLVFGSKIQQLSLT